MKKIIERIIMFVVGLPLVISSVYFLPYQHFLILHLEIFAVTALSIIEIRTMFSRKIAVYSTPIVLLAGMIIPVAVYLFMFGLFSRVEMVLIGIGALYFIFFVEAFYSFSKPFEKSIQRVCSAVFMIFYPGFLIVFLSAMTRWTSASNIIAVFLLMVFSCDSLAWLFGVLFGKGNRGFVPASPNKSIVGFIGGLIASTAVGFLAFKLFPADFGKSLSGSLITGFCTGVAAIIGDLIESIFKRSAEVKDSGALILGRGGILDSIDSILLAAPIFYLCYRFFVGI
ncbi:phosphatidate cytidylyltransferase [Treponema sp. OMZ 305]|uniref:phosphatidate cytidylyltransferase n=1 Tax=Treponema TaxID=157 RepID=UPI001BAFD56F|nr:MULTISPECIES: phosphatidate cytidylyltransferase [Treponema]QUY18065.1 phosphatidate cytidylyltransferase [Treponema vincentii]UTC58158.1 phosphatidate cytidylyltransferase [Treponema sp. OMZ 305]